MKVPTLIVSAGILLFGAGCSSSGAFVVSDRSQAFVIDGTQQTQISSQGMFQPPTISVDTTF